MTGVASTAERAQLDAENPWPGLASYDESSHEFFSGRAAEADDLCRRILAEPVTVLFGKSGLGKTSLLKAGVFPRLREKGLLPILIRLHVRRDTAPLIEQVRLAMCEAMRAEGVDFVPPAEGDTLWEYLHRTGQEFWTNKNRLVRPLFVFDQFEELFTIGRAVPADVERFREDLADLAENRIPAALTQHLEDRDRPVGVQAMPYKIVLALREDFLADLEEWRLSMPSLRRNRMRLLPMGPDQAFEAVFNARTSHLVSPAIARKVVAFLSTGAAAADAAAAGDGSTVEPALLSLFCQGVNEQRKRAGKPCFDEALLEGGKGTIVADFYRTSVADQPERVRRFIEEQLVTEQGFRNSYAIEDAIARGAVTARELDTLVNLHLLRHEHHLGADRIELTHDLLTKAVVDERDRRRLVDRTAQERWQRLKLGLTAAAGVLLALVFAVVAMRASNARKEAESREFAALSGAAVDATPDLAVALALDGLRRAPTSQARSALMNAAQFAWPSLILEAERLGGSPSGLALSADGMRLAVLAEGKIITLWDVSGREPRQVWKDPIELSGVTAIAFSPDQTIVAIARRESIELRDAGTGTLNKTMGPLADESDRQIAFSPDNEWLASTLPAVPSGSPGDPEARLQLWNYRGDAPAPVTVRSGRIDLGFAVVRGGPQARIIGVNQEENGLAAYAVDRQPDGSWVRSRVDFARCMNPQSVSPGTQYFTATWRARACMYDAGRNESNPRPSRQDRPAEDIVWSTGGRAYAELWVGSERGRDLLVGTEHGDHRLESRIKGTHPYEDNVRTQLISVSDDAKRVAVLEDAGREYIQVYSLLDHKPLFSPLDADSFAIASDGSWFAVAAPASNDERLVIEIARLDEVLAIGEFGRVRQRITVDAGRTFVAAADSLVVLRDSEPRTSVVYDVSTGEMRYGPQPGRAEPIGRNGELLLFWPERDRGWRLINTRDGSPVPQSDRVLGSDPSTTVLVSPGGEAIAVLRADAGQSRYIATVYRLDAGNLRLTGTAMSRNPYRLTIADDGRSLTDGDGTWPVTTEPAVGRASQPARLAQEGTWESPRGQYELREQDDVVTLVRRGDATVLKRFNIQPVDHRFSTDDRWLATWSGHDLKMLDLARNEELFTFAVGDASETSSIDDVEFVGGRLLRVRFDKSAMIVPLDNSLMDRFASWLVPADRIAALRCAAGLGGNDCPGTAR